MLFEFDHISMAMRFHDSIPDNRREAIFKKIFYYFNLYASSDSHRIHSGARPTKFRGIEDIYKFRINKGERIIFSIEQNKNEKVLVLREYSTHDKQERAARTQKQNKTNLIPFSQIIPCDENLLSEDDKEELSYIYYEEPHNDLQQLEEEGLILFHTDECISEYAKEDNQDYLWYPSDEQADIINKNEFPQFITGSAGTGKTTVLLYKLFQLSKTDSKILYITVSKPLKDEVAKLFQNFASNEETKAEVTFQTLDELFAPFLKGKKIITQKMFLDQFFDCFQNKLNIQKKEIRLEEVYTYAYTVWCEIEGILKAHLGIFKNGVLEFEEQLLNSDTTTLSLDNYINTNDKYCYFSKENRKEIYEFVQNYNNWIIENKTIMDVNQAAVQVLQQKDNLKYDFIIIDEVQDFTELQLYMLINLTKSQKDVIFSGDMNQNIRPTVFDFSRLYNIYYSLGMKNVKENTYKLTKNHRSCKEIVSLLNKSLLQQRKRIGAQEIYLEEIGFRNGNIPIAMVSDQNLISTILDVIFDKHYAIVIVPDEAEYKTIYEIAPKAQGRIFTVQEAKGLEYDVVIAINVTSNYEHEWEAIEQKEVKYSKIHRQIFGYIYVAASRAKNFLTILEKQVPNSFLRLIDGTYETRKEIDLRSIGLDRNSTYNDFIQEAEKLEKFGLSDKAEQAKNMAKELKKKEEEKIHSKENVPIEVKNKKEKLGKYLVAIEKNGYWSIEDQQGNTIYDSIEEKPSFEAFEYEKHSVIKMVRKGKADYIDWFGNPYIPKKIKPSAKMETQNESGTTVPAKKSKRKKYLFATAIVIGVCCISAPKMIKRFNTVKIETLKSNVGVEDSDLDFVKISDFVKGKITKVAINKKISSVLNENGELWVWGGNDIIYSYIKNVKDMEVDHNIAVITDKNDSLWIWKHTDKNDTLWQWRYRNEKNLFKLMDNIKSVPSIGMIFSAIDKEDTLWVWYRPGGNFENGIAFMDDVESAVIANSYGIAVKKDHTLWEWGGRQEDYYWVDDKGNMITEQTKIMDNVKKVIGDELENYTFAIKEDNTLWTWGRIRCSNDTEDIAIPKKIMDDVENVLMARDNNDIFVLKNDGSLWDLRATEIRYENLQSRLISFIQLDEFPVKISDNVIQMASGYYFDDPHLYALLKNGDVVSWNLWSKELPNENNVNSKVLTDVVQIAGDENSMLALKKDGSVWACGKNDKGQLGDGTDIEAFEPIEIIPGK